MIKLFRNIRKNLLNEGKTSKYFKYAIGEIILVVIGILIALSINNWNQNRINETKLKSYLTELVKDLKNDTLNIRISINRAQKSNIKNKAFLAIKDYNAIPIDSLEKSLETFYSDIRFSSSTFQKIESSGITNFGEYENLIEELKIYYNFIIPSNLSFEGTHNRAVDNEDNYWRYNQNHYEFTYDEELATYQSKEDAKRELVKSLQSPIARNILKINYRRNKNSIKRLKKLNNYIINLIETTESKLND